MKPVDRRLPVYGSISAEQQALADECARDLEQRRDAAAYEPILENRRPIGSEVNCAACDHLGDFNDEGRRGFCLPLRRMRSTWHPARCRAYVPLKRDRTVKVVWKGVVYG